MISMDRLIVSGLNEARLLHWWIYGRLLVPRDALCVTSVRLKCGTYGETLWRETFWRTQDSVLCFFECNKYQMYTLHVVKVTLEEYGTIRCVHVLH